MQGHSRELRVWLRAAENTFRRLELIFAFDKAELRNHGLWFRAKMWLSRVELEQAERAREEHDDAE